MRIIRTAFIYVIVGVAVMKRTKSWLPPLLAALPLILLATQHSQAHSGGTDAYGCHNETATGNYHCHSGPLAGQSFSSKSDMLRKLDGQNSSDSPPVLSLPYHRDDYLPDWADADHDCINTRHEVLIEESLIPVTMSANGCSVARGLWHDPYTDFTFTDPADLDIDHMVPLKEAHVSGAAYWTTAQKRAYANDMGNPLTLIAVDDGTNSSKGDKDPATWMPPNEAYHCEYIKNWVAVKDAYNLSMDAAEEAAIEAVLPLDATALPTSIEGVQFTTAALGAVPGVHFEIGVESIDKCGYQSEITTSDIAEITGAIFPLPQHVGRRADIYLVDRMNMDFKVRTESGSFAPWSGNVPDLVPWLRGVELSTATGIEMYAGTIGAVGNHRLFLGYKIDGVLYYTPYPVEFDVIPPDGLKRPTSPSPL
jgi:hypothetical protein